MPKVLDQVKALNAYSYRFKWQEEDEPNRSIGFMAQDVRKYFPELVNEASYEDDENILQLNYAGLSVVAIKAIQEQQAIIDVQNEKIASLEQKMNELLSK